MIQYIVFHCVPFFIHSSRLIHSDIKQTLPTNREPPAGPWVGYQRQDLHLRPTHPSLPPKRALSSTEKLNRRNVGWEQLLRAESKAGESEDGSAGSTKRKGEWFPVPKPQLLLHRRKRGSCLPPSVLHYHYSHYQIYSTKLIKMYRLPSICSALPCAGNHRGQTRQMKWVSHEDLQPIWGNFSFSWVHIINKTAFSQMTKAQGEYKSSPPRKGI